MLYTKDTVRSILHCILGRLEGPHTVNKVQPVEGSTVQCTLSLLAHIPSWTGQDHMLVRSPCCTVCVCSDNVA